MRCFFFFEEILRSLIFIWRNNEEPHFFWRNNEVLYFFLMKWWGTWFDSKEITRHFIFSEEIVRQTGSVNNKHATHVFSSVKKSSSSSLSLQNTMKHLIISSEKMSISTFLQKKTKHFIISSEKKETPHYLFQKKSSASLFYFFVEK